MIIRTDRYVIISYNSNNVYWEEGLYPVWTAFNAIRYFPVEQRGTGVEPHYHDGDEIWLFTSGKGEVWLDGEVFDVTPNTVVYTPMGVVHRFQMFTDFGNTALVTRLERQKRPIHILVEEAGPPEPTVPGFVVSGDRNKGPFAAPGPRCPLSELRLVSLGPRDGVEEGHLSTNEHWLVREGSVCLTVDGFEVELSMGDVALLQADVVRRLWSDKGARVVLARER